jgi:hypothetical protein
MVPTDDSVSLSRVGRHRTGLPDGPTVERRRPVVERMPDAASTHAGTERRMTTLIPVGRNVRT